MNVMIKIITILSIFSSLSGMAAYSQGAGKNSDRDDGNALLPGKCYIKYLYEFPYESKPVFYSERYPDLETRNYFNTDLIEPLFKKILKEGYQVSDPNYWGSVEGLVSKDRLRNIDTSQILRYMHAGWDSTYSIDENGKIALLPVYNDPDFSDVSGLFFFESWYLNARKGFLTKEVIAYFPIYEYWDERSLENGEQVKLKRLICMIFQKKQYPKKIRKSMTGNGYKGYQYLYRGVKSELDLFNRPYSFYLHRDQAAGGVSDAEFNEWEYHTFDFYRDFNAERFLEEIISLTLDGRFIAEDPSIPGKILTNREILAKVSDIQNNEIRYDNLNSVAFNEDWYINPDSMYILKKVNSITIFRHEYQFDEYTGDLLRVLKTPLITVSLK